MEKPARELTWSRPAQRSDATTNIGLPPALLDLVLENINTRVAVLDRDRRYTYANRHALQFMGLPAARVIGSHISEVLDAGVCESFTPLLERLFAGEALHMRGWVEYEKQGRRYREQALVPFSSGDGPVQAVVVCGWDHTDLRVTEQELADRLDQLHASETLKSAIVDHALAALVSTDAQGQIVEFNPSAQLMFGHERGSVIGRRVSEVIIPERLRIAHEAGMQRVQAGGAPRMIGRRMELSGLHASGHEFPIEMVLWRTDVAGTVFYTSSMVDVSERHSAAAQIERHREALRQSEKLAAMGSLLAGVAHELNNPLAIAMGRASLLEEKCEALPELKRDAGRIREAADRCGRIVRTFLNMARSRPPQRTPVALNEIVRAAVEMLQYSYRSHGIDLEISLAEPLPAVSADGDQIGQVVMNLLVNAQQALTSASGTRRVWVQSGVEQPRDGVEAQVWLRVTDNGPGVLDELRSRVFEPFFTTKPEGLGTGLGLAVSRSLARDHGGDLTLDPWSPRGGATFVFSLPIDGAVNRQQQPSTLLEPSRLPQARILVVDDEAELGALMRDMLEGAGYDVATAESGAVALELLKTVRFDAIVSDLRMPDMDGAGLWREVSRQHPSLARHMVFITGDTLSPEAREFLRSSRCASLDKLFSKADLLNKVVAALA